MTLLTVGPTTKPKYSRDLYRHWVDENSYYQDARVEVLVRDVDQGSVRLRDVVECQVELVRWGDPYTGNFVTAPSGLDVDHMVAPGSGRRSAGARTEPSCDERVMSAWTTFRITWPPRGGPIGDRIFQLGHQLLRCVAELRGALGESRWHYKWTLEGDGGDFLRVECDPISTLAEDLIAELRRFVGSPNGGLEKGAYMTERVLAPGWTPGETHTFATVWWRWSELLAITARRCAQADWRTIRALHPQAFGFFTSEESAPLEAAFERLGSGDIAMEIAAVLDAMRQDRCPISYRLPPTSREDALDAARVHYLMNSLWASDSYPWFAWNHPD